MQIIKTLLPVILWENADFQVELGTSIIVLTGMPVTCTCNC